MRRSLFLGVREGDTLRHGPSGLDYIVIRRSAPGLYVVARAVEASNPEEWELVGRTQKQVDSSPSAGDIPRG